MMKIIELAQRSKEWKDFRKSRIGASDSPVICGVNPYKNPAQLWKEKKELTDVFFTESMQRGIDLEIVAIGDLEKYLHGSKVESLVAVSDEHEWMMASFDAIDMNARKIWEIKSVTSQGLQEIEDEGVPLRFTYQLQHQLYVSDYEKGTLLITDGERYVEFEKLRDEEIIDEILKKGEEFHKYLAGDFPPTKHEEREDCSEDLLNLAYVEGKIKELEKISAETRERIISRSNGVSVSWGPFNLSKVVTKGKVDYKAIPELSVVNLEMYRKPAFEKWVFTKS